MKARYIALLLSVKNFCFCVLLLFCVLFIAVLPLGQDLHFHLYRIGAMAEELRRASFAMPIRILSASYNDYGYGSPLFYGDIMLYIPAMFVAFGMNAVTAYKMLMIIILLSAFGAMYHQAYRSKASKDFAFLAAVFYVLSSYFLLDLCVRMSIGEACALVFLPFVFCSFYNILYQPKKGDWLYLSAGMSGLMLSHNLTFAFAAGILGIWTIAQFRRIMNKEAFASLFWAALAAVGLTASYLFPFIEAGMAQKYQIPENSQYQIEEFAKHALDIIDFFAPYEVKKGISALFDLGWNTETWHPGAVGIFLTAIAVLEFLTVKVRKNKVLSATFWISAIIYLLMFAKPIVDHIGQFMAFTQFGWRLLAFCTFAFSVYAAYLLDKYFDRRWQNMYVILAILTAFYTIGPRYAYQIYLDYKGMEYIKAVNEEYYAHYIIEYSPNSADNLYLPEGVPRALYEERGERAECNNDGVSYEFTRSGGKCYVKVLDNEYEDTSIELPLYYYKGYAAIDRNTGEYAEVSPSADKLVEVSLRGIKEADLEIWYKGTLVQKLSDAASALTVVVIVLRFVACGRKVEKLSK